MTSDLVVLWLALVLVLWALVTLLDRAVLRAKQRLWERRHTRLVAERDEYPDHGRAFNWPARPTMEEER